MASFSKVEQLFFMLDRTALMIQESSDVPYLDALADTGEHLFTGDIPAELPAHVRKELEKEYSQAAVNEYEKEDIRKAFQLAVLKGMKEAIQPNHAMTPDAVSLFISYLVQKLASNQKEIRMMDPVVGAGNLLTAVLNQLQGVTVEAAYGVEVDETLLRLAWVNANLQQQPVEFFHQDVIMPLYVDPVDVAVADLPIGYYPLDDTAKNFNVFSEQGHTFAHHLIMEQTLNHLKPAGFAIFIIPNGLFETEQAPLIQALIKKLAIIHGVLQLPESLFKSEGHGKSLLILQKEGEGSFKPKQALLVNLPSFSNKQGLNSVMKQMDDWFKNEWKGEK